MFLTMRCAHCLARNRFVPMPKAFPLWLYPLSMLVEPVRCDSCLHCFFRVRWFGWIIPR